MDLEVTTFDDEIVAHCKAILENIASFQKLLGFYNPSEKEKGDRIVVQLVYAIQSISKIILPALSTGEIQGLPREATEAAEEPDVMIVNKEQPDWDFRPWFYEKFGSVQRGIEGLIGAYETDLSKLQLAPNSGMTPLQYIVDQLKYHLRTMKIYTEAILEMFESEKLTVKDVRLRED
jgi:hypothetical protein